MAERRESAAVRNMKAFWSSQGRKLVEKYERDRQEPVSAYITHGDHRGSSVEEWIDKQLVGCRYVIITANPVESQTIKRLLYEEARDRKIYKYWMAVKRGIPLSDEHNPKPPALPDGPKALGGQDSSPRSPQLLEVNLGKEVQYYFVTLGGVKEDGTGGIGGPVSIAYICPSNTSSFSGNGSHKAIVHALRRYSDHDQRYPFVASLGVAFGLRPAPDNDRNSGLQYLGDVLISRDIIAYDSKYKVTDAKPQAGEQPGSRYQIEFSQCEKYSLELGASRAFSAVTDRRDCRPFLTDSSDEIVGKLENTLHMGDVRCHMGTMYSGGAVVSSPAFKKNLLNAKLAGTGQLTRSMNPIGGEMEGVGIWYACLLEDDQFPCIVVKGICDWGEEKNGWSKLLKQDDHDYFMDKLKQLLPAALNRHFQYDDSQIAVDLMDQLIEAFQKEKEDEQNAALEAAAREAAEQGIDGEAEDILKALKAAYGEAEDAVNDLVKDAVQAYATEQAFKAFCFTIYDDPQLASLPARTPNESKRQRQLQQLLEKHQQLELVKKQNNELTIARDELRENAELLNNQLEMQTEQINRMKHREASLLRDLRQRTEMISKLQQELTESHDQLRMLTEERDHQKD